MAGEDNSAGTVTERCVVGPGADEPLVWYHGSGTTDRRWLIADERGSIIAATGSTGSPITNGIQTYDEYGRPGSGSVGRFGYTGQAWVPEIGLSYYKARSEEHTSELQSLMRTSYAVSCLQKKKQKKQVIIIY